MDEIDAEAAAERLGLSVGHVRTLQQNGVIAYREADGRRLMRIEDVDAFGERRAQQIAAVDEINDIAEESSGGWGS